ncbi:uncharacterized protein V6R79_011740 [Siganus canaliculatus]
MSANDTCGAGDEACAGSASGSPVALAVGLTVFFLLLVTAAAVVFKYHRKIRSMVPLGPRQNQKKDEHTATAEAASRPYHRGEQSTAQTPIYENLGAHGAGYGRHGAKQSRLPSEPEEDLYLQCDLPDDAIYSNDPACNLSFLPDQEDVYIVPDS